MAHRIHHLIPALALALGLSVLAAPAAAQTGIIKGRIVDPAGQPVSGVQVAIEFLEGNRKLQVKTDRRGDFMQVGLMPGNYRITATHEKLGTMVVQAAVRSGQTTDVNFALDPSAAGAGGADAKTAALKKVFQEGVELSEAGNHDAAIAKFEEAATIVENCFDCYYNIGYAYLQKKDEKQAEAAFLRSLELNPNYVRSMNTLATLYNGQKRFEDASAMSARAAQAGGASEGGVDAIYNQGVILWNAGNIKEARAKFEEAVGINASYAPAHYQLGMAQLNEGQIPEAIQSFETYLKLAPEGEFAAQAKALVAQLKGA